MGDENRDLLDEIDQILDWKRVYSAETKWEEGGDARLAAFRALVNEWDRLRAEDAQVRAERDRLRKVVWGVVYNAERNHAGPGVKPLWGVVMELTALGSTAAHDLCREFGRDPAEPVGD